jgi:hypothetical protein
VEPKQSTGADASNAGWSPLDTGVDHDRYTDADDTVKVTGAPQPQPGPDAYGSTV